MRAAAAVVAVAVIATLVALGVGLASRGSHLVGTNSTRPDAYVTVAGPDKRACQSGQTVPADAGTIALFTGVYGRPGPPLTVFADGRAIGRHAGGYRDGWLRVPLTGTGRERRAAAIGRTICVENDGAVRLALGGTPSFPASAATVGARKSRGAIALRWYRPLATSWWDDAGTVAQRVTFGRADLGPWTPAFLALVWAGAFALILRVGRA